MKTIGTFQDHPREQVAHPAAPLPSDLDLEPLSRRPIRLSEETIRKVTSRSIPIWRRAGFEETAAPLVPLVSIIVVVHNNLLFTRMCLESVLANTDWRWLELIVVDNGSTDGTQEYLSELAKNVSVVRVISPGENLGFAEANNLGFSASQGEMIVLLNNDTIVADGWLPCLSGYLQDSTVGAVGPVTNRACNQAQVAIDYRTYGQFARFAAGRMSDFAGQTCELPMLSMYCMAMWRRVMEEIGPLDGQFEIGMFEDDDYSMRLRAAGKRLVCAEDCFIHHFGEASLGNLVPDGQFNRLFEANRVRFERKWGVQWKPHGRRPEPAYESMIARVREAIERFVPAGSVAMVVNKGDPASIDVPRRTCRHFPADEQGNYSGHYPADGPAVVAGIQRATKSGGEFLVIPESSKWWLEFYPELRTHLESAAHLAFSDSTSCVIYRLDHVTS
jgi:GT2 family glycosyltransferase